MRVALLIICAAAPILYSGDMPLLSPPTVSQLIGNYYRGDHMGYNISLNLNKNGEYSASWHGCLGEYGTATGAWSLTGFVITLNPVNETGMMKDHLRDLPPVLGPGIVRVPSVI